MNHPPRVSVCIPVYNCAIFLESSIKSVLAQTFTDFELIIVDNYSNDGTGELANNFLNFDPRIRVYHNENTVDMETNWNRTVAQARGEYIKLLPADDLIFPSCLIEQVAILDNPNYGCVGIVGCARDIINADGKKLITRRFSGLNGLVSGKQAIRKIIRSGTNPLGEPGSILFRKSLLDLTGLFDGHIPYVIDLDLWVRLLIHTDLYMISKTLCGFRLSSSSESVHSATRHQEEYNSFIKKLASEPQYGLVPGDALIGKSMCSFNSFARHLFYRWSKLKPSSRKAE